MGVHISSSQLESFVVLARELKFARAARMLNISQPALTKRIQSLEGLLGQVLFLRQRRGLVLTESGRTLQRFAVSMERQELDLLEELIGTSSAVSGFFRLVSFSSCLRSILIPAVGPLLRDNPRLSCQFIKGEIHQLHELLVDGKVDFCVSLSECERMDIENIRLGIERNVLIESSTHNGRGDCYIDHDPDDSFTERFFLAQTGATAPKMLRAYFDDIYGLIDAVAEGIGRAVVPLHLIQSEQRVRPVRGFRPHDVPVFLHYRRTSCTSRMHAAVVQALMHECQRRYDTHAAPEGSHAVMDDALIVSNRRTTLKAA